MSDSKVLLKVEDFRAISQAQIKLDGITVVAGINGCGKSTISKLLYWVYRGVTDISVLANAQLKKDLKIISKLVVLSIQTMHHALFEKHNEDLTNIDNVDIKLQNLSDATEVVSLLVDWHELFEDDHQNQESFIDFFKQAKIKTQKAIGEQQNAANTIKIFYDILKKSAININMDELENVNVFDFLIYLTNKFFGEYQENIAIKPRVFLDNKIKEIFHIKKLPDFLEISEDDLSIFKTDYAYLSQPYWTDNVIYIDTPMLFQNSGTEHWEDVNKKLKIRPDLYKEKSKVTQIDDLIKKEILTGQAEIKFDELSETFVFKTPSGAEIDLSDSATGIKAFAVLSLLVKNKSINDKTLLILDEPEAHLHPQWIIEFGRLLTLIHKHIGAKIFVATHSPDMVQALRYIPNKENIGDKVNFYLAKADDDKNGQFIYQDLNGEIDDIFLSFNISLDKLAKYGED